MRYLGALDGLSTTGWHGLVTTRGSGVQEKRPAEIPPALRRYAALMVSTERLQQECAARVRLSVTCFPGLQRPFVRTKLGS